MGDPLFGMTKAADDFRTALPSLGILVSLSVLPQHGSTRCSSKLEAIAVGGGFYCIARLEFASEYLLCQRVLDKPLNGPLEGSRSKGRIKSFGCKLLFRAVGESDIHLVVCQSPVKPRDLNIDYLFDLVPVQGVEDDNVIHAIEEFRLEVQAYRVHDSGSHHFFVLPGKFVDFRRSDVRRHYNDSVLEIHCASLAVREPTVIEDL